MYLYDVVVLPDGVGWEVENNEDGGYNEQHLCYLCLGGGSSLFGGLSSTGTCTLCHGPANSRHTTYCPTINNMFSTNKYLSITYN